MKNLTNGDISIYCDNIKKYGLDALEGVSLMNAREILNHITMMRDEYVINIVKAGANNPVGEYPYPEYVKSGDEHKYWLAGNSNYQDSNFIRFILLTYIYPEAKEIYPTVLKNKFLYEEAHELVNAIVTKEITIRQRLVFTGNQFENAIVTYRTQATKMKFDNLSVNREPDIKLVGFPIYLHRMEQLRRFTFEMFDKIQPAKKVEDVYSAYLNERLQDVRSRNSIIDSHLKTSDLSWLIEQERNTLKLTLEHINLFYEESELRQAFIEICESFVKWLKPNISLEKKVDLSLKSIFKSEQLYNDTMKLFVSKKLIEEGTHFWIDDKKSNKTLLSSILKSLFSKGYFNVETRPTISQYLFICKNSFKCDVSKSTFEKAPTVSQGVEFIQPLPEN